MMEYNFTEIEEKWKKVWAEKQLYKVTEDQARPKYYVLDMFPYPSGAGLHVGHPLGYVASDIYARYKRLKGYNVLHPMGYDAFGLPAEQYAIETGTHPAVTTEKAMVRYKEQLDKIGFCYDWDRKVVTCEPGYYKWTQWLFLQLYKSWYNRETNKAESIETLVKRFAAFGCDNTWIQFDEEAHPVFTAADWSIFPEHKKELILQNYRLVYRSSTEVNWCEALGSVLANDEIKDGKSERGGYPVTKKKMRQWSLRITEYADRLLEGLNRIEWSDSIKEQQRNWIGRSEGAIVDFKVNAPLANGELVIQVFTTRVDTLFGVSFLVLAPESELVSLITTDEQKTTISEYLTYVKSRTDVERQQEKRVTGAFTGSYAVHPVTGNDVPVYIAEYVLAGYGTGAIMAVPADDERDRKFAEKFELPVIEVIDKSMYGGATIEDKVGKMINSGFLDGMEVKDAISAMLDRIETEGIGKRKVNYKLRDASFSRQRYWGEPFPIKYKVFGVPDSPFADENPDDIADIPFALDEILLPLELPVVSNFKAGGDGRSPLANSADWVANNYETDTMPGYAGSSWYFLRYMDPHNAHAFASKEALDYWQQVDLYLGGSEHAVGHLLYSRFFTKVLHDLDFLKFDEPFKKLVNQGMITGKSSFIYNVDFFAVTFDGVRPEHNPQLYVSADFIVNGNLVLPEFKANEAKQLIIDYYKSIGSNIDSIELPGTCTSGRVSIEFVDAEKVDIAQYAQSRLEFDPPKLFVKNDNGEFLCTQEVEKMSKSKYNVVNPDDIISEYGADCFRMYEMFLGPLEQSKPWDQKGINGTAGFLRKLWRLFYDDKGGWKITAEEANPAELKILHKLLKKIEYDMEHLSFNTSVSAFMIAINELTELKCSKHAILNELLIALAPFAPFTTEELWAALGNKESIHLSAFPQFNEAYLVENSFNYPVSVNGKLRATVELSLALGQDEVLGLVTGLENVKKWMEDKPVKKVIFVKGKIINIVV
jgi:leucyl-tRNA synthetase